ncbi:MAG TPA: hypothetical protein VI603_11040 [Saprospiraceae bacterium]|nr:hypothetical protein [Saprospiraceae bacterium]
MKLLWIHFKALVAAGTFIPLLLGCHLSDKQTSLNIPDAEVSTRADDCSDCGSDCCCFIELDGDDAASIHFCGTTDGAGACMHSECGGITGGSQLITLSVGTPRKLFCEALNSSFRIKNWSTTDEADIIISCQAEDGTPQTIMVHLNVAGTPGDTFFYSTNGDCELDDC